MAASSTVVQTSPAEDEGEDWADLDFGSAQDHLIPKYSKAVTIVRDGEDAIPEVSTISRPEDLTQRPPYWLVVRQEGTTKVVVNASHAPSLACLDAYLKKWCRGEASRVNRVGIVTHEVV